MKILIVSNLYPPYYRGGYEVRCAQVADALHQSGYDVCVLTSVHGLPLSTFGNIQPRNEEMGGVRVYRWLNQYAYEPQPVRRPWTLFQAKRELWDARQFVKILANFQPDIVNWWNMNGLSKTLLPLPHSWGIPDVHWIEGPWMIHEYGRDGEKIVTSWANFWDGTWGPRICRPFFRLAGRRVEKRIQRKGIPTRAFPNQPRHVCFVSAYLRTLYREAGLEFRSSEVIYGGVPTAQFYEPVRGPRDLSEPLRLLYAGQISPDRGLHTVVDAIGHVAPSLRSRLTLTIAGHNASTYFMDIKARVQALGLTDRMSFLGKVPHEWMPRIYKQHDVLVFPSTRPEGLPLTMIEAMLAGCAVLTTGSGGAMEIAALADLPLFPKDDPTALSRLLTQLVNDRSEVSRIASRGQEVALREFSFDRMMERWTTTLRRLHENKAALHSSGSSDDLHYRKSAIRTDHTTCSATTQAGPHG